MSLGSRLDTRITGGKPETFVREAKLIMVDIDKGELSKRRGLKPYLEVNEDCKFLLINYLKKLSRKRIAFQNIIIGTNYCKQLKKKISYNL